MNKDGDIQHFPDYKSAKAAGYDVAVTTDDFDKVQSMNRHERRKWYAEQRRKQRKNKA